MEAKPGRQIVNQIPLNFTSWAGAMSSRDLMAERSLRMRMNDFFAQSRVGLESLPDLPLASTIIETRI